MWRHFLLSDKFEGVFKKGITDSRAPNRIDFLVCRKQFFYNSGLYKHAEHTRITFMNLHTHAQCLEMRYNTIYAYICDYVYELVLENTCILDNVAKSRITII